MSKVLMTVYNNFTHDSRVLKEANSLIDAGYDVEIVALLSGEVEPYEEMGKLKVHRVGINPVHLRFIKFLKDSKRDFAQLKRKMVNFYKKAIKSSNRIFKKILSIPKKFLSKINKFKGRILKKIVSIRRQLSVYTSKLEKSIISTLSCRHTEKYTIQVKDNKVTDVLRFIYCQFPVFQDKDNFVIKILKRTIRIIIKVCIYTPISIILLFILGITTINNALFYILAGILDIAFGTARFIIKLLGYFLKVIYEVLELVIVETLRLVANIVMSILRFPFSLLTNIINDNHEKSVIQKTDDRSKNDFTTLIINFLLKRHRLFCIFDFNKRIMQFCDNSSTTYDIVHSHDLNTLIFGYRYKKKYKTKLIYDSHELYLERNRFDSYSLLGKKIRVMVERKMIRKCDDVITVNVSIADYLADIYKVPVPKVIMNIPSAKEPVKRDESFSIRKQLSIPDDKMILLYSGAITFNRGIDKVIMSLKYNEDIHMVCMGYGADKFKDDLVNTAKESGVIDRFHFFGPVPGNQVTSYAASADIGVAPIENVCLSYYFCSPNKLFEYLLAGLPVITSNFPEMSRLVDEFGIGLTFDPSSPEDIARTIKEALVSEEIRSNVISKTREVISKYCWENEEKKLINMYEVL
ncbi:MAG: hypothetical protein C0603_09910 [Denitrovibrio sp.]|nr:MAG: hypothetical protein C0603_09910 [Denitrovibrio sp.]